MTATKSKLARDLLESAKKVLRLETKGLQALSDSLNETFSETLDLLLAMQGRAVVTGMGKSGHIANKISATFASTGTPSFFLHPARVVGKLLLQILYLPVIKFWPPVSDSSVISG